MAFTQKFYFAPGAISMVTHMALEEIGAVYQPEPILIFEGQHLSESYRRVHPLARVPALEIAPGVVLTETPALLTYLADSAPEKQLLPQEPLMRARANEWMSLFASALHVSFITFFLPQRYTSSQAAAETLSQDGKQKFWELMQYVESRLPERGYLLGERYSLVDAYLTVFLLWARRFELPVKELPRYSRIAALVLARPAVRRTLEQEGFGHVYQQPSNSTVPTPTASA